MRQGGTTKLNPIPTLAARGFPLPSATAASLPLLAVGTTANFTVLSDSSTQSETKRKPKSKIHLREQESVATMWQHSIATRARQR